jgi:hypothetical protein
LESNLRRERGVTIPYTVGDAVAVLVKFRGATKPNAAWGEAYKAGLGQFEKRLRK